MKADLVKVVVAERSGRITLGTRFIKRYGKKFKLVKEKSFITLIPLTKVA
ncbi:hypothetical protein HYY73_00390 [Candidatus Woesearchaeota archaeon]|nr:hypothetical protein [Candidatus Woesearchaeota archaeon]